MAHNGFSYDFPILMAEIERRSGQLSVNDIITHNIDFADTLPYLRQAKKDGFSALSDVRKFGLEALVEHFLPGEQYSGTEYFLYL